MSFFAWMTDCVIMKVNCMRRKPAGGYLNIKMPSYQYRDFHVKDKTVSPTILSLPWESSYLGKMVFKSGRGPAVLAGVSVTTNAFNFCNQLLVTGEFPSQRPVRQSFDVFFHLCLNKWLSKKSWGWWFQMQSRSLWCHCNVTNLSDQLYFQS